MYMDGMEKKSPALKLENTPPPAGAEGHEGLSVINDFPKTFATLNPYDFFRGDSEAYKCFRKLYEIVSGDVRSAEEENEYIAVGAILEKIEKNPNYLNEKSVLSAGSDSDQEIETMRNFYDREILRQIAGKENGSPDTPANDDVGRIDSVVELGQVPLPIPEKQAVQKDLANERLRSRLDAESLPILMAHIESKLAILESVRQKHGLDITQATKATVLPGYASAKRNLRNTHKFLESLSTAEKDVSDREFRKYTRFRRQTVRHLRRLRKVVPEIVADDVPSSDERLILGPEYQVDDAGKFLPAALNSFTQPDFSDIPGNAELSIEYPEVFKTLHPENLDWRSRLSRYGRNIQARAVHLAATTGKFLAPVIPNDATKDY